ncbi:MAG TPA: hypothetical protein VGR35_14620 [Tepidisphaeraceae bacterium]|nr:hypothetical protein [Tepidisphaeraceae bacterium]
MSGRVCMLGSSFAVALLLVSSACLTPARGKATTAPAAPTTAPEPMVDNPHYLAWSKYKPGTQVDLDMKVRAGGQQFTTNVTLTLEEVTPERAVVESVSKMHVPGLLAQEQKQVHTFSAKVPKSEAEQADLPPGSTGEVKDLGTETIQVAGKRYDAKVIEFTGSAGGNVTQGKMWRSDEVPGGLLKMESSGPNVKVDMVLKKVTEK